jgi:hypothetical protein
MPRRKAPGLDETPLMRIEAPRSSKWMPLSTTLPNAEIEPCEKMPVPPVPGALPPGLPVPPVPGAPAVWVSFGPAGVPPVVSVP